MKQKHNHSILNRYTASTLMLLVIAAVLIVVITRHNHINAAPSVKPKIGAAVPSEFKFTGVMGWWQGATNKTSMAVFHSPHDCFISIEHDTGTIAAAEAKVQKSDADLTNNGYTVTQRAALPLVLQSATGQQPYMLQQSSVTTPTGASQIEGGQEFGYIQLSDGYLKIMGYCDTPAELPATLSALQAVKFDPNKLTTSN